MALSENERDELRKQILLGFHTQFAENQRSREDSFLKFLALLGGALAGYVFLFQKGGTAGLPSGSIYLFQAVVSTVLAAGTWLITVISNNFRRDQFVNAKIRHACGLFGPDEIFPSSYDPRRGMKRWGLYGWFPDLFKVFYWLFILFEIGALLAFCAVTNPMKGKSSIDWYLTLTLVWSAALIGATSIGLPWWYRKKLRGVMELDTREFSVPGAYTRRIDRIKPQSRGIRPTVAKKRRSLPK